MHAADHLAAMLGEDPFELAGRIEAAAVAAGRLRAEAAHMERVRKVVHAEASRAIRDARAGKTTVAEIEGEAYRSAMYREHLDAQRAAEIAAAEAEAAYYGLRNRQDWMHKAADASRAEAYLAR